MKAQACGIAAEIIRDPTEREAMARLPIGDLLLPDDGAIRCDPVLTHRIDGGRDGGGTRVVVHQFETN